MGMQLCYLFEMGDTVLNMFMAFPSFLHTVQHRRHLAQVSFPGVVENVKRGCLQSVPSDMGGTPRGVATYGVIWTKEFCLHDALSGEVFVQARL